MDHRALEFGAYRRFAAFVSVGVGMIATAARTSWFPMRNSPLEMARVTGKERQYVKWTCRNDTNAVCLEHLLERAGSIGYKAAQMLSRAIASNAYGIGRGEGARGEL